MRTLASGETDPSVIAQAFRTIPPPGTLAGNMVVLDDSAKLPAVDGSQLTNIPYRTTLSAARTYFVRTDGSDSNNGLANTAGGAFLTIQKAINTAAALDTSIFDVTISVAAGTYTGAVTLKSIVGAGRIILQGDTATPSNVFIDVTSATALSATNVVGYYQVKGFKFRTTTSGHHVYVQGSKVELANLEFSTAPNGYNHIYMEAQGYVLVSGPYTISGGTTGIHWAIRSTSYLDCRSLTITLTGTPAIGIFAYSDGVGNILAGSLTFTGAATGQRYNISGNGVVNTGGGGATYFPGNAGGATATGGQYI